jgi:hypothetical protein
MIRRIANFMKWYFRSQLLIVALCGYFLFLSAGRIDDAFRADAPYLVAYGEDGEVLKQVSRQEYLRHEVGSSVFMLLMALLFWGLAADSFRKIEDESKKELNLLKWKLAELEKMSKPSPDM